MFSFYTTGSSVSTKRPQVTASTSLVQAVPVKSPPSPLISGDHKKTPTPSTVSTEPPEELMTDYTEHLWSHVTDLSVCSSCAVQNSILSSGTSRSRNSPITERATLGVQNGKDRYCNIPLMYRVFVSGYESRGSTHQTHFCEVDWC